MAGLLHAAAALAASLSLSACLVTPGKFEAALDVRADRSFSFSYKGEILASDMDKGFDSAPDPDMPIDGGPSGRQESAQQTALLWEEGDQPEERFDGRDEKKDEARMQAIAAALTREKGFRAARYMGDHRFEIDYAISGRLTHAFLFPFNSDAEIILPFIAVELRADDRVRIKAPGFSNGFDRSRSPLGGGQDSSSQALDGVFTLTTDAEIVSQNQEDGAREVSGGKQIMWRVTPQTSEAPAATLRLRPSAS